MSTKDTDTDVLHETETKGNISTSKMKSAIVCECEIFFVSLKTSDNKSMSTRNGVFSRTQPRRGDETVTASELLDDLNELRYLM